MREVDPIHCSRPLLVETGHPEFPYRFVGAGLLATYRGAGLIITAAHVLTDLPAADILVFPHELATETIALTDQAFIEGEESYRDVTLFRFDASLLHDTRDHTAPRLLPLSESVVASGRGALAEGAHLTLVGMPSAIRDISYDDRLIIQRHAILRATYAAPDQERNWIHAGLLNDTAGLVSFDGFSGGAVLTFTDDSWGFAGLVIEGTISSRRFHFIDAAVIYRATERFIDNA